ncbi:MAG: hypothetical protein IJT35_02190 [Paludibacteraceae bacterium]|nr:hypothetical protein [Paludibacteraceae bacterium]
MKHIKLLWLFVSLILAFAPTVKTTALDDEVEIELMEVAGFLPGDNPLDDPLIGGDTPPSPADFRATIAGSMLSVTADNSNLTRVIVRNSAGNIVLNRQFVGGTMEQLGTTGNHSIEIQNGGMTLVGMFSAF